MTPSPEADERMQQQLRDPLLNEHDLTFDGDREDDNDLQTSGEDVSPPIFSYVSSLKTKSISSDQITAMLSNFSTSYNAVSISLVIPILQSPSLYLSSLTETSESLCASSILGGMIVGQLIGGALGDTIGRWNAMYLVMGIQIVGTFGSALLVWDNLGHNIFDLLAAWRFVLGIGCGGVYPLAAALSAEQKPSQSNVSDVQGREEEGGDAYATTDVGNIEQERERLQKLALTFSTQGVGFVMVPIVTYPLLLLLGPSRLDYVWRIVLGIGVVPGLTLAYLKYRLGQSSILEESEECNTGEESKLLIVLNSSVSVTYNSCQNERNQGILHDEQPTSDPGLWQSIRYEPNLLRKLCGTALTWFLFDIVFYGNTLFQPIVLEAAFGTDTFRDSGDGDSDYFEVLLKTCRDSFFLTLIALPGYFITIAVIGRQICGSILQTPTYIQGQGFIVMSILYTIIGSTWNTLKGYQTLLIVLYGGTFFFANYGPNTTTFLLPNLTFSKECRTTLNGISAACGKLGAVVGASMFEPLAETFGDDYVMLICAGVSFLAAVLTLSLKS